MYSSGQPAGLDCGGLIWVEFKLVIFPQTAKLPNEPPCIFVNCYSKWLLEFSTIYIFNWTEWLVCSVVLFSMRRYLIPNGRGSRCGCFEGVGLSSELLDVLRNAATVWLVSLEYKSAFQDMAHLALSLQYVLQWACIPSAVPERFCKRRPLSPRMYFCRLQLSFLSPTQTNLLCIHWWLLLGNRAKGSKKGCL